MLAQPVFVDPRLTADRLDGRFQQADVFRRGGMVHDPGPVSAEMVFGRRRHALFVKPQVGLREGIVVRTPGEFSRGVANRLVGFILPQPPALDVAQRRRKSGLRLRDRQIAQLDVAERRLDSIPTGSGSLQQAEGYAFGLAPSFSLMYITGR